MTMADDTIRLLIVDDDEVDRMAIRRALQAAGLPAAVDEELGPEGVIERVSRTEYDCVILDQSMPGEDGLSLIRRLREAGVGTPILVVTGQDDDTAAQLVAAGASDYLPKADLSPARLVRRLRYAMRVGRAEARAHDALHELASERTLFAAVLRQMPAAVMIAAVPSGKLLLSNDQVAELLGQPAVLKDSLAQLGRYSASRADGSKYGPDDWPLARAVARAEIIAAEEMILERPDGRKVIVRASAQPVHDATSKVVAAVMTLEDLTTERRAQGELERAAHAREEILAIVSHDLRNPLNAVSVAIDELADPDLEGPTRLRYVTAIRRAVGRADRLIRDLLDVSRIEAGKLSIDARPVTARALLEQAAREHEVLARDAGMGIKVSVDGSLAEAKILADRDRVLQAVGNLIGNALRYARGKGDVDLSLERHDSSVRIWVADKGPGIPADALPHIFDHYWQANRQRRAGAGLGLSIVQGIAAAHGGSIHAENRDGGGARFCLCLPAVQVVSDGP
jgi:signal transduction histidine kinase